MEVDPYSILIVLSLLVVFSYFYNYLASKLRIPSVLLLICSGIGLKLLSNYLNFSIPPTHTLLELLGISGLIFIVLEAALDLKIEKERFALITTAFLSALCLLAFTSLSIAMIFMYHYDTGFHQALLHALPLSVISSAIAIPSVSNMETEQREFVIYESTFSDILGIIAFNYLITEHSSGWSTVLGFGSDLILIVLISVASTVALVFLLNHVTTQVRFFLTFAIIILTYSFSKFWHLPSLILVLCFGLVINNFDKFNYPIIRRFISFDRLRDIAKEMRLMTAETAFIIRTFFFLLFGFTLDLKLLQSVEVLLIGLSIILLTLIIRFIFLNYALKIKSAPLALIAPRGLITVLLFYSIPPALRMEPLSEGVLFVVIALTSLSMTFGLLISKR